jgi:serine/threonine-protein kinase
MTNRIGKYRIDGELGRGGFGTVYRAWDPTVDRAVAIKVLTVPDDKDLLSRFRNEAAAQGRLHHPNIVTVHDFGEQDGTPYMVMQLLEGETLQEILARKTPLTLIQKMNIMGQVAAGLHHAHLHGIVHRDVKPANIMILPDSTVQIMDFGIARLTASTLRQTRTGFVVGTAQYMAPEQFLPNKAVDHRADIWANGVIYYEMLTGTHPFAAADSMSVLFKIANVQPEPLPAAAPDCPPALDEVIGRLLAKDPDLRYQSLRDAQFDLQPVLLDLKRERAVEMLVDARRLQEQEKLKEAQAAAQQILELDPGNREVHTILNAVKARIHRKLIEPKVNSLVEKAEKDAEARAWQLAIQELESALRLSNSDPSIQSRLQQVKKSLRLRKLSAATGLRSRLRSRYWGWMSDAVWSSAYWDRGVPVRLHLSTSRAPNSPAKQ